MKKTKVTAMECCCDDGSSDEDSKMAAVECCGDNGSRDEDNR